MTDTPLFTFAVIADTHINAEDGVSGSPWPANRLANDRARWAVAALNADTPAFVVHLGDMVHPIPTQPGYGAAAARYHEMFAGLNAPLYCLPGNHDLGDKPVDWMPAHPVTAPFLSAYEQTFGPLWQAFTHGGCRFVLHANPILGADLPQDAAQWAWLEGELAASRGERVFFLTHYPLFLTTPDEPEHYDNLAPGPRERLRALLVNQRVEAVFAAHVHTIFHTPLAPDGPMQHVIPALSAMRLDYSHLFKTPPRDWQENGRNDSAKLGYYLVDVYPQGYALRLRRSHGACLGAGEVAAPVAAVSRASLRAGALNVGVDLRQGWAEPRIIPYTGVVDEFRRKAARNDYLITALQEAGLRDLRVPLDDLTDPATQARIRDLARMGHRFQPFAFAPPDSAAQAAIAALPGALARIEVIARADRLPDMISAWRDIAGSAGVPLIASKLWTSADVQGTGAAFSHFIGHGFTAADTALLAQVHGAGAGGAVFRIAPDECPQEVIAALPESGTAVVYLTLSDLNPARINADDAAIKRRVLSALAATEAHPARPVLMIDTLEDLDRGYYPRHGLYDGQFNPRPAGLALALAAERRAALSG
ncbi:metallophosphoesterase family protein [Pararhodobacter sp.]|uniref:metallophosphoesterase family protein n=1 Tax=Pararhodobacter sp. TaxID=2127056 RepID=UPI002FDE43E1